MLQLIHSSNHETSSFVEDILPEVVNKVGTVAPPFSIPYAISNSVELKKLPNRRAGNHPLVRIANIGRDKLMEYFRALSLSTFLVPNGLDTIITSTKCYLIVLRHILCETLQKRDEVTLEDIERLCHIQIFIPCSPSICLTMPLLQLLLDLP